MDNRAIGVFDSGLGGLTAAVALKSLLPNENIVYLGDTLRVPYGDKSCDELKLYAESDIEFLLSKDVKAIVIACGTVSSTLERERLLSYGLPVFEVLTPAVEKALACTKNKKVGVIATAASIRAGAFERLLKESDREISVYPIACPKLVPLIESGKLSGDEIESAICEYLAPLKTVGIDTLILGCTHYPLLKDAISAFLGHVALIDIGFEAAKRVKTALSQSDSFCQDGGEVSFYVSGDEPSFKKNAARFLGYEIDKINKAVL